MPFEILVKSILPEDAPGILTLNVDLEVDFDPPPGYVEPKWEPQKVNIPTMADRLKLDLGAIQTVDEKGKISHHGSGRNTPSGKLEHKGNGKEEAKEEAKDWEAFKGNGNTLQGKRVKGKGVSVKPIEQLGEGALINRTE
jgi:ubiquitin fusion degradation protein 1